ncbi:marvel domain-containing protein [Lineolata rhizophorae]|uniref:Marvel domain-containing protein n=1 Tax=Lineolata rhizophorae TaxID=578093 RepID=A0A6A6PBV8_9PEZI|nr:marvel domain-containing protein [Lineolata rhizophorae]
MMIVNLALRFFQLLFAAVVLGLSVSLIKKQEFGDAPATMGYSAFTGGFGLLAALVGTAAIFMEAISGIIILGVDGLTSLIFLAGGIAYTVGLRDTGSCGDTEGLLSNDLTTGGCVESNSGDLRACGIDSIDDAKGRCKMGQADSAFMFLGCIISIAIVIMVFISSKRGGGRGGVIV